MKSSSQPSQSSKILTQTPSSTVHPKPHPHLPPPPHHALPRQLFLCLLQTPKQLPHLQDLRKPVLRNRRVPRRRKKSNIRLWQRGRRISGSSSRGGPRRQNVLEASSANGRELGSGVRRTTPHSRLSQARTFILDHPGDFRPLLQHLGFDFVDSVGVFFKREDVPLLVEYNHDIVPKLFHIDSRNAHIMPFPHPVNVSWHASRNHRASLVSIFLCFSFSPAFTSCNASRCFAARTHASSANFPASRSLIRDCERFVVRPRPILATKRHLPWRSEWQPPSYTPTLSSEVDVHTPDGRKCVTRPYVHRAPNRLRDRWAGVNVRGTIQSRVRLRAFESVQSLAQG